MFRKCKNCGSSVSPLSYFIYLFSVMRRSDLLCEKCDHLLVKRKSAIALLMPSVVAGFGLGSVVSVLVFDKQYTIYGINAALPVLILGLLIYLIVIYNFMPIEASNADEKEFVKPDTDDIKNFRLLHVLISIPYIAFVGFAYITSNYYSFALALVAVSISGIKHEKAVSKWLIVAILTVLSILLFEIPN